MSLIKIERLDHHGLVAGVVDELGIVEIIDNHIRTDEQETVSCGEAVKAMIINGLGFSHRPLMLTPQFYENLPTELLFRSGVTAEHFNRHKLGRSLDEIYEYGCDSLFSEIALAACHQEGVELKNNSLDTTSFSLSGSYDRDFDQQAIEIKYGHSKDHRPDLKQAVQELLVSQDGGVPLFMKCHDGSANDSVLFQQRAKALLEEFKKSEAPRYLIADSKLYSKTGAEFLAQLPLHMGFCQLEVLSLNTMGPNNLDFHLAFHLGRFHEIADGAVEFHIVTNDAGFNGLVNHIKGLGRKCKRVPAKQVKKKSKAVPQLSPCAALVVERLGPMDGRKRPRKKAKLVNWIKSQCAQLLNGASPVTYYEELKKAKIIRETGSDVAYEFKC